MAFGGGCIGRDWDAAGRAEEGEEDVGRGASVAAVEREVVCARLAHSLAVCCLPFPLHLSERVRRGMAVKQLLPDGSADIRVGDHARLPRVLGTLVHLSLVINSLVLLDTGEGVVRVLPPGLSAPSVYSSERTRAAVCAIPEAPPGAFEHSKPFPLQARALRTAPIRFPCTQRACVCLWVIVHAAGEETSQHSSTTWPALSWTLQSPFRDQQARPSVKLMSNECCALCQTQLATYSVSLFPAFKRAKDSSMTKQLPQTAARRDWIVVCGLSRSPPSGGVVGVMSAAKVSVLTEGTVFFRSRACRTLAAALMELLPNNRDADEHPATVRKNQMWHKK